MDPWHLLRLVSQRSLLSCRLEFEDRRLDRASLFPLFDDEGRTRMVLITAEENGRIMLADWTPDLFAPRWVLGDDRYQGHGAVPHLRSTNIPGYDKTMSGVAFDPSLGRASHVVRWSSESASVRRFTARTLAAAIEQRRRTAQVPPPRAAAAVGWQLRPFWRFP